MNEWRLDACIVIIDFNPKSNIKLIIFSQLCCDRVLKNSLKFESNLTFTITINNNDVVVMLIPAPICYGICNDDDGTVMST